MRIKLDENIPHRLVDLLAGLGHDVDTVDDEALQGADDSSVWEASQRADRFLITQDLDFSDLRRYAPGTHHGLLLVRLSQPGREALLRRILGLFSTEKTSDWTGCFLVATDRKLRIKRPQ
jgi:predicted nuclease of predicted toxin-antitoxin system